MRDDERLKDYVSCAALEHLQKFILEGLTLTREEKKVFEKQKKVQKAKKKSEQKAANKSFKKFENLERKIFKEFDIEENGFDLFEMMSKLEDLTEKEGLIVELLKQGYSYAECAEKLFISVSTIKTHIDHIFSKKGVSSLQELLVLELTGQIKGVTITEKTEEQTQNNALNLLSNLL